MEITAIIDFIEHRHQQSPTDGQLHWLIQKNVLSVIVGGNTEQGHNLRLPQ